MAYDGTYVAKVGVMNLTVVQQPIMELASRAVRILVNMIQGKRYHDKKCFLNLNCFRAIQHIVRMK